MKVEQMRVKSRELNVLVRFLLFFSPLFLHCIGKDVQDVLKMIFMSEPKSKVMIIVTGKKKTKKINTHTKHI